MDIIKRNNNKVLKDGKRDKADHKEKGNNKEISKS